jgi:peroxiredoxin
MNGTDAGGEPTADVQPAGGGAPARPRSPVPAIVAVVAVVVAALVALFATSGGDGETDTSEQVVADAAPPLVGTTTSGDTFDLADEEGRWALVNFFATWCPPCQEETPVLRDAYAQYRDDGLELIAVSVQESTPADVAEYAETYSLDYTIGFDATGAVFETYQGYGLPTHVFIDRNGVITQLRYGPVDRELAAEIIEPLLEPAA